MSSIGTVKDPQHAALGALVGSESRVRIVTEHFLEDLGVIHFTIPSNPVFHKYEDSGIRYIICEKKVPGGALQMFVHEVDESMRGTDIRAHALALKEERPDGTEVVYIDLYPTNDPATNRIAVGQPEVSVLSSASTWRYVLPPPLKAAIIAGALDMRFHKYE